jgi:hypothetical protein
MSDDYKKGYQAALDDVDSAANKRYEECREMGYGWLTNLIQELKDRQKERE